MTATVTTNTTNTYTKLRDGSWGIRAVGKVSSGQWIDVTKKDGSVKREAVAKVLWTGDGMSLCTIGTSAMMSKGSGTRHSSSHSDTVKCRHCGQRTAEGDDWCMVCGRADYER